MRLVAATMLVFAFGSPVSASVPKSAPPLFVSMAHGVTFSSPRGSSYCPLPPDWVGSDHGTVIFLAPPASCGGAGYPSSSRGFQPADTPRIELFYSYWDADDAPPPAPCDRVGDMELFGHKQAVCETHSGKLVVRSVRATYMADADSQIVITLVTTPGRLSRDMVVFRDMVRSVKTCSSDFHMQDGKHFRVGVGGACPDGKYF